MLICLSIYFSTNAFADVKLPDVISDSMVLQRDRPVFIWGKADAREAVTVVINGQTKKAAADQGGDWRIKLDPMRANTKPSGMSITGKNKIELKNILIGEVWLVSGQSNMEWTLNKTNDAEAAIASAKHPLIRLFQVRRQIVVNPENGPIGLWKECTSDSAKNFSAAGYYFALELQKKLQVPIGVINASWGGTQAEAWTPIEYLNASPELRPCVEREKIWNEERPRVKEKYDAAMTEWKVAAEKTKAEGKTAPSAPRLPDALRENRIASSIYNGMIIRLIPYTIRGAIWYQGESNVDRAQQYELLLPTMIKAWRDKWGQGNFPFGIVQLPNYHAVKQEPQDSAWSHLREAQRLISIKTPDTGLIVIIDIGVADDIHPKNKLDVGKRMYLWAARNIYQEKIIASGPMFRKAEVAGSKIIITFDNAEGGLKIKDGDNLDEFVIAGEDKKFIWAEAKIIGKNQIEVSSSIVLKPVAVRYAFNDNPVHPNLTNQSGLPASPFRTDNFSGPTDGKR